MESFRKLKLPIAIGVCMLCSILLISGCEISWVLTHGFPSVEDGERFPGKKLKASSKPYSFTEVPTARNFKVHEGKKTSSLDTFLQSTNSSAFLVMHCDTLIYERYFGDHDVQTTLNTFSVTKSFLGTLVGCALEDGYIDSIDQAVTDFIPELPEEFKQISLRHLLQMRTGITYPEAGTYYHDNLRELLPRLKLKNEPDKEWVYRSINSQVLGLALERALKGLSLTEYLQMRIWEPLGMESDAVWNTDRSEPGLEKAFCCLNATARDLAKLGRLYLNHGRWDGEQLISQDWVQRSVSRDTVNRVWPYYGYHWWLLPGTQQEYMARGFLGQYVYVNPVKEVIIVRLGSGRGGQGFRGWERIFASLSRTI